MRDAFAPAAVFVSAAGLLCLLCGSAWAHDPSAYGGLFRSSDAGATWLPADGGLFVGGAMSAAYRPSDPNFALYGTDNRLMASLNGGRDWTESARGLANGPVFAVAFTRDGGHGVAATGRGLLLWQRESGWIPTWSSAALSPAYAIVPGQAATDLLLAGPGGVFASADAGHSWSESGAGLPAGRAIALAASGAHDYVVVDARLYRSSDGGHVWQPCAAADNAGQVEALDAPPGADDALLAAGGNSVFETTDGCVSWHAAGAPVPAPALRIHSLLALPNGSLLLATSRGLLRSADRSSPWQALEGNLPVHLEAGPLVRAPQADGVVLAGFALTPYDEIRRAAEQGGSVFSRADPVSLAGAAAFLVLLGVCGVQAALWLARRARGPAAPDNDMPMRRPS